MFYKNDPRQTNYKDPQIMYLLDKDVKQLLLPKDDKVVFKRTASNCDCGVSDEVIKFSPNKKNSTPALAYIKDADLEFKFIQFLGLEAKSLEADNSQPTNYILFDKGIVPHQITEYPFDFEYFINNIAKPAQKEAFNNKDFVFVKLTSEIISDNKRFGFYTILGGEVLCCLGSTARAQNLELAQLRPA